MLGNLSIKQLCFALALLCLTALSLALVVQYILLLEPCVLCMYQRYVYIVAFVISLVALCFKSLKLQRILLYCYTITIFAGSAIAFYHLGIEQSIFTEPLACSAEIDKSATISIEDLRSQIYNNTAPRCSQVSFKFIGVSMAGWNGIFSLVISLLLLQHLRSTKS